MPVDGHVPLFERSQLSKPLSSWGLGHPDFPLFHNFCVPEAIDVKICRHRAHNETRKHTNFHQNLTSGWRDIGSQKFREHLKFIIELGNISNLYSRRYICEGEKIWLLLKVCLSPRAFEGLRTRSLDFDLLAS